MRDNTAPVFTAEMKKTHTLLVPQMLPIHFDLMAKVFAQDGYKVEVLKTEHRGIVEEGLKSVHNDTCYPALLVIGQFIDALKSGKYDIDKTALLITQTGGGCRASNYIYLLRKALIKNGFSRVPVVSLNFSGLDTGFKLTLRCLVKVAYALFYADFLMCLYNQTIPYETNRGDAKALVERWTQKLLAQMETPLFVRLGRNYKAILKDFAAIPADRSEPKVKVGIVGEIYLKYAPLGNNGLEEYLVAEGCEVVNSGLMDFVMYCVFNRLFDRELYGHGGPGYTAYFWASRFLVAKQRQMVRAIKSFAKKHGVFTTPAEFERVAKMSEGYIDHGVKMGEGWLLTAEMLELIHSGVNNIVSAQPFGCLPNHIVAKGMIRKIKDNFPFANIIAVDYDPGASRINQENRIKLMLANAKRRAEPVASTGDKLPELLPVRVRV